MVRGSGFGVQGSWFGVPGSWFGVRGSGTSKIPCAAYSLLCFLFYFYSLNTVLKVIILVNFHPIEKVLEAKLRTFHMRRNI